MTKEEYIRDGGEKCPYCNGDVAVEHMSYNVIGKITHEVVCIDCKECWYNIYTLTDIKWNE